MHLLTHRRLFNLFAIFSGAVALGLAGCADRDQAPSTQQEPAVESPSPTAESNITPSGRSDRSVSCGDNDDEDYTRQEGNALDDKGLLKEAKREGTVSVIVTLDIRFTPEGELEDQDEVDDQRARIAQAQNELMESLKDFNAEEDIRYERLRQMVLTVDHDALLELAQSPLVASVQENVLDEPTS